jgi:hypothetical protein
MSFIDGKIGNRRNTWLQVRLTSDESNRLENMAASYDIDKSELVRQRLFGRAVDYVKSEINGAIEKVRNGYQRATRAAKNYFSDPEDIYSMAYAQAQPGYGVNVRYR